jgi:hypothetical protein
MSADGDRYLVGANGYFVELSSGSLAPIGVRAAFPLVDRFPSLGLDDLSVKNGFGPNTKLLSVPASGSRSGRPNPVEVDRLVEELMLICPQDSFLMPVERYIALRILEAGAIGQADLKNIAANRADNDTLGQALIAAGVIDWETLLTICLDVRPASRLDPPSMRTIAQRREWELIGEILIAMRKLNRTKLEEALQIKREGNRAIGEILTSMGACTEEDIRKCLELQDEMKHSVGAGVALIGQLLISRGVITFDSLESAIRNQKVGRQSLERILRAMGACTERDVQDFARANGWHSFQDEIDDVRLGHWLEKVGTISRQQLEEALRIQERGRQVLGELLVSLRLCSSFDIQQALSMQKEIREDYKTGVEKLGSILIKNRKVDQSKIDEALRLQSTGRQKIGSILVALRSCTEDDVEQALAIQRRWREHSETVRDRLGEVLLADGVLSEADLNQALSRHTADKLPLGRVLVDQRICTPEQIVSALVSRDYDRQLRFRDFLNREVAADAARAAAQTEALAGAAQPVAVATRYANTSSEETFLGRLSSWIKKRK